MIIKKINQSSPLIKPAPLLPGETIAVISPAGPIEEDRLKAGVDTLVSWGYSVKIGKSAHSRYGYFSSPDSERLNDLTEAFSDPQVRAIFCARGGYGSGRLLSKIPYDLLIKNPKIFVGFSDVTALNWAFYARSRLITFSGPTAGEIGDGLPESARKSFLDTIGTDNPPDPLRTGNFKTVRAGRASGLIFPGCLSVIVTLLGTPYLPNLEGAILLIEEVNEKPYRVDRMLTHLKNAGILDRISALLIGGMIGCWPKARRRRHIPLEDVLLDLTSSNPIPIYTGLPYGHNPNRLTLPVGVKMEISETTGLRLI